LRRKRLFEIADELACNKLALGHNKDDIIETLFLNIFYTGEILPSLGLWPLPMKT
jgi:tRNA 2-thiocytidine biosynthesis protein TtcA